MRRSILARSVVVTASAALLVAGCGGGASSTSSKNPKAAFTTGISKINDTDVLTITLKVDTSADTLLAFAKANGKTLSQANANDLVNGQLVFEQKTLNGKKLSGKQTDATTTRFVFSDNGTTYVDVRARDKTLYVKADVKGTLDLFGKSKLFAEVQARAKTLPAFVQALVAGQWVSIDIAALGAIAGQFGGGGGGSSPGPGVVQQLLNGVKAAAQRDSTVTRVGTDDAGDHLRLTSQTRQLVTDLFQTLTGAIPVAGLLSSKVNPTKMPDRPIVVDAWVNDGTLAKVSFDLAQFADATKKPPGTTVPVVLTFARSGDDISKPDSSTPADLTQLLPLLGGLGG